MGPDHRIKYWSPKLIELTQIGSPDFANGETTACFVNPHNIVFINYGVSSFYKSGTKDQERHPTVECTTIWLSTGAHISVVEKPDEVARRRDRALEVPVELRAVLSD